MVQDGPRSPRTRRPRRRLLVLVACVGAAFAAAAGIAAGAVGDLSYAGCITGELTTGPTPGTGACAAIASATSNGNQSGVDNPQAMAASPDGKSLYLASGNDAAVARFDRDPATGVLTYQGCITGETESGPTGTDACAEVPEHQSGGSDSGFDNLRSVAVSPDGTSVYAVSGFDHAVVRFDRNTSTRALTYQGCITGETESGPTGTGACAAIPDASVGGDNSGLGFLTSVAISANGASVYVASAFDDAVARFDRNTSTGALTYQGCITGETESGPTGTGACAAIPDAASNGSDSGLDDPVSLAVSADGESLYAATSADAAVAGFDRTPATGALAYQGCITGETESGPTGTGACAAIPAAAAFGSNSGLAQIISIAINAGGESLYAVSHDDDALARFDRAAGTGLLTYQGCLTGETETGPTGSGACTAIPSASPDGDESGVDQLYALTVAPGGGSVHAVSQGDDGVATFGRDTTTGAVTYRGCITGETQSGPTGTGACAEIPSATVGGDSSGFDKPRSLAVPADNTSLYAGSPADDAVLRFGREPETPTVPPPPPEPYKETCFGITIDGASITGDGKNNKLNGTALSDQLRGGGGNDKVRGDDAGDCLFGNADKDKVNGQDGDDVVRGGSGNDKLSGGKDDDTMRAQDGNDKVKGGAGDDSIKAQGRGRDKINCGAGTDSVVGDIKDKISANCEKVRIVDPR